MLKSSIIAAAIASVTLLTQGSTSAADAPKTLPLAVAIEAAQAALASCKASGYNVTVMVMDQDFATRLVLRSDAAAPRTVEIARRKGPIEDADRGIANALGWFRQNGGCWCAPELLRLEGELALAVAPGRSAKMAEKRFKESLSIARRDGAHSWELRAAISLARLLHNQNRAE